MNPKITVGNILDMILRLSRYNLKIIFANKFIFFLLGAVGFFLFLVIINLFSQSSIAEGVIYYYILFPGILLIFYPTTFGIQNDADARMLEILFGIPNYRYKVWLVRLGLIYGVVFVILLGLAFLAEFTLAPVAIFEMVYQLMFPIFFLGCLAFMVSTLVRNGNGTAVVMVVLGMGFWISSGILEASKWNIFLNPFMMPSEMNEVIWMDIIFKNRVYLVVGTILCLLYGLLNLQKREKFV